MCYFFFFQAEDGIRDIGVTGVQTCALPILVEFEDNRGYRVAPVSLANLAEVTHLRCELECLALRHAMAVGDVNWEGDIVRALHRLNRIVRNRSNPETLAEWERTHRDFHLSLIAGCAMPLLLSTCRVLLNLNDRYRR